MAKRGGSDLALLGGRREFSESLHVGRPFFPDRKRLSSLIDGALDRRWVTNDGPLLRQLEAGLEDRFGAYWVLVSSGTSGLQLSCRALGIRDSAAMPAFTFVATPNAFEWEGVRPVFCDVSKADHQIAPAAIEVANAAGIVGVHLWGATCDAGALGIIANRRQTPLLFDAAHAFGVSRDGLPVGQLGRAAVFSFHATKCFSTIEGGAASTNDEALARELRMLRDFGFTGLDETGRLGINAKMNELSAAVGLAALPHWDSTLEHYRENLATYREALEEVRGVRVYDSSAGGEGNCQYVVALIDPEVIGRDALMKALHAEGVLARRYFYPGCHRLAPYVEADAAPELPNTDWLAERVLVLPTGPSIRPDEILRVCDIIRVATDASLEVASAAESFRLAASDVVVDPTALDP